MLPTYRTNFQPFHRYIHRLTALLLALFLVSVSVTAEAAPSVGTNVGDYAPDFSMQTLDKQTFTLKEWRGKQAVYLIFWATWCPNCKREIPKLSKLSQSLKNKVVFLAINAGINDSIRKVQRYQTKYPMAYPIAFDEGSPITKQYNVMGTPTQIIIDINGIIRYRAPDVPEDMMDHVDELLNKNP